MKADFARWLVEQGITSISLNPDCAIKMARVVADAESTIVGRKLERLNNPVARSKSQPDRRDDFPAVS